MIKKTAWMILSISILLGMAACSSPPEAASPLIGTTAPDFRLANTEGGETSLSDFAGTPVILFFHMASG
ncbi:MAG: redoxin domain-containing protein [Anaerolineales bacterium]|nr:redoxin domain-containing protein [Anaerolineales bacterium]